jgi:hypothetical protein
MMRHPAAFTALLMAFVLAALASPAQGQAAFKVPFKFESGGKKFPAGDYVVTRSGDGQLAFQQLASGKETAVPFTQPLPPPTPLVVEPRLVFDEVGNFEPSYTEYFTVYVLAEVWLSGQEGYLVHVTKGAHKNQVVKGEVRKK